ncbi:uncharacterized protein EV154DRAFT_175134 [Mucor mucedo]|uniref:uncharacterized protein n=1 Tax=Mucor mucedo TaxID=29922 RepID=UPI002220B9AA|nr:uncharacterized protein EV154DRAFT_175134 [Mucor mucedo]KAI7896814.1 hypothetical protein EV154DRAFT_175134 [Mucor mucedo]
MGRVVKCNPADNELCTGENGHVKHSEGNHEKKRAPSTHFVERVTSIPLIKDSVSKAQDIANKTALGRFTLSQMNSTLNNLSDYASKSEPMQNYYKQYVASHVQKADEFGCKSLDVIQTKIPIMNQPTSDIYQNVINKPRHELFGQAKIKLDSTISTVTYPAHVVIRETNKQLGICVDSFEGVIDKYLPADEKKDIQVKQSEENQVVRVYDILSDASRRLTHLVTKTLPTSRGDLSVIAENNTMLQNLTSQIRLVQETLVQSVSVYGNLVQEKLPTTVTTKAQKTSELFAHVSITINDQLSQLVDYVKTQPDLVKQKLHTLIETTKSQFGALQQEFARQDISYVVKVKHVAGSIGDQILPLLQQLSSQLEAYSELTREKIKHELNVPLHYFGLNQKIHTQ